MIPKGLRLSTNEYLNFASRVMRNVRETELCRTDLPSLVLTFGKSKSSLGDVNRYFDDYVPMTNMGTSKRKVCLFKSGLYILFKYVEPNFL